MRYIPSPNCFAEVKALYDSITPVRGTQNAGLDIRPLDARRKKWERIIKISRNCYVLTCGYTYGDPVFQPYLRAGYTPTPKDLAKYAPIVWRKHRDGTETVTVRNGTGPGLHTSHYAFLRRWLPRALRFRMPSHRGQHFIECSGTRHFLPKGRTVPKEVYERRKGYWPRVLYQTAWDGASLAFEALDDRGSTFRHVAGETPAPAAPRKRVNRERKAKLKPHIDAFREWATAIVPLLSFDNQQTRDLMEDLRSANPQHRHAYGPRALFCVPEFAREVLIDDQHPARLLLAIYMRDRVHINVRLESFAQVPHVCQAPRFRAAYNAWVNNTFDLVETV